MFEAAVGDKGPFAAEGRPSHTLAGWQSETPARFLIGVARHREGGWHDHDAVGGHRCPKGEVGAVGSRFVEGLIEPAQR